MTIEKSDVSIIQIQKIHDTHKNDKRCKLDLMKPEYKLYFDSLIEALEYTNATTPLVKKCRFYIGGSFDTGRL